MLSAKVIMSVIKKIISVLVLVSCNSILNGQQVPFNPVSYKIFIPSLLNPAIAGSKDFFSTDIIAGFYAKNYSQVLSGNARIIKKVPQYVSSYVAPKFTGIGIGYAVFNEMNSDSRNIGLSAAGSYHLTLNKKALSFLSIGIAAKGIYHHYDGDSDLNIPVKDFYIPGLDAGLYFYNPSFYAGISATNILGRPVDPDTLNTYIIPISRQYFFLAGFKFLISRPLKLVLEPSVILMTDDTLSLDIKETIKPALRLYAGDFCLGTYFNDLDKISFFFEFRYPRFYIGTFFELPKDTPFYKKSLTAELVLGFNLSSNSSGYTDRSRW